jgi:hypothetical protein
MTLCSDECYICATRRLDVLCESCFWETRRRTLYVAIVAAADAQGVDIPPYWGPM